jgi:hypothetical protein
MIATLVFASAPPSISLLAWWFSALILLRTIRRRR